MSTTKKVLEKVSLVSNGDMSAQIISKAIDIAHLDNIGILFSFPVNAAATGTFYVDVSIDGLTWNALDITPAMTIPDADNSIQVEVNQLSAALVRVRYVPISGSGTLNAYIQAKEL